VRKNPPNEKIIGLVSPVCSPKEIAEQAVHDAAYMCSRTYGDSPQVTFHGRTDLQFPYVPSHTSGRLRMNKYDLRRCFKLAGAVQSMLIRGSN
jgi:hypothetical protein